MASTALVGHGLKRIEEMAYYAGIVDGEGSIAYYKSLSVAVEGLYPKTLIDMYTVFGGSVSEIKRDKNRRYYRWRIFGQSAAQCLQMLLPYLREKKEQAEVGLEAVCYPKGSDKRLQLTTRLRDLKRVEHGPEPTRLCNNRDSSKRPQDSAGFNDCSRDKEHDRTSRRHGDGVSRVSGGVLGSDSSITGNAEGGRITR